VPYRFPKVLKMDATEIKNEVYNGFNLFRIRSNNMLLEGGKSKLTGFIEAVN
jgi:hypothetical protein